jgi:hypothetical protein
MQYGESYFTAEQMIAKWSDCFFLYGKKMLYKSKFHYKNFGYTSLAFITYVCLYVYMYVYVWIAPSTRIFRLQKRIIRIMMGSRSKDSCRKFFTSLEILPLPSLYIFSLLRFVIKNKEFSPQIMRLTIMVLDNTSAFNTLRLI